MKRLITLVLTLLLTGSIINNVFSEESGTIKQLTSFNSTPGTMPWSKVTLTADGQKLYFTSKLDLTGGNPNKLTQIFCLDVLSKYVIQTSFFPKEFLVSDVKVSGDGSRLAFEANYPDANLQAIFIINPDGTGLRQISPIGVNADGPTITYDGSSVLYNANSIYIVNVNNDCSIKKIYNGPAYATISGDGSKVLFYTSGSNWQRFSMNADGSNLVQVTNDNLLANFGPLRISTSYDGHYMSLVSRNNYGENPSLYQNLFRLSTSATEPAIQVTHAPSYPCQGIECIPNSNLLSADGKTVVYSSQYKYCYDRPCLTLVKKGIDDNSTLNLLGPLASLAGDPELLEMSSDAKTVIFSSDGDFTGQNPNHTYELFAYNLTTPVPPASPTAPFLSFPLAGYTPYTAEVSAVMDHSRTSSYSKNGTVLAFNNEQGDVANGCWCYSTNSSCDSSNYSSCAVSGFRNSGHTNFLSGVIKYTGSYLYYDGHPGYDYPIPRNTPIYAPADGIAHIPSNFPGYSNAKKFNTVEIDHLNGYKTYYLHLNSQNVTENENVYKGTTIIGYSGEYGSQGALHLHFEVQNAGVPIDPYGWQGSTPNSYEKIWTDNPLVLVKLNVAKGGTGTGTVSCGDTCLDQYVKGTVVTLTASPSSASSIFKGWSVTGGTIVSGCASSGSGPCEVKLDADTTVTGTFSPAVVNPPKLTGAVTLKGWQSANVMFVNLKITNTGLGNAQNIITSDFAFKTLAGSGAVTYNTSLSPAKPVTIGNLNVGESKVITIYLNVPSTVTRFSISEGGTVQDVLCQGSTYLISQTIFK